MEKTQPKLHALGAGRLRWFGLHVYDSTLWVSGKTWSQDEVYALDIRYARNIKGVQLTQKSVEEIERLGFAQGEKLQRWETAMARVFPDIKPGDRLVGVSIPGKGAAFYSQTRYLGSVDAPEFAQAFFAIWLDPRTSEPGLRAALLAQP
ncbi:MAG: chalcone isomerase family protein [Burkholderiales bacterium]